MSESSLQLASSRQSIQSANQRPIDLFRPSSFGEAMEFAKVLAESQMVPKQYLGKPYAIIATWQYGLELGVGLMQALQGISNINGTPAVFGDLGWALVQNHPDFVDSIEDVNDKRAICTLKRRGRSDKTWEYTIDMARTAGLLGKDNWKNNPKRMLQWRARSWCMRDQFPDSLKGMVIVEEAQDIYANMPDLPPARPQASVTVPSEQSATTQPSATTSDQQAQPEPEQKPEGKDPEAFITLPEAKAFADAWKASGFTIDEAKKCLEPYMPDGVAPNSMKIKNKDYAELMAWAKQDDAREPE